MPARGLFRAGALTLIVGGLGHFGLVDLGTLWLRTSISSWTPLPIALPALEHTTLDFGPLGSTLALRAMEGFSVWVGLSLVLLGLVYLTVAAQRGVELVAFTRLGLAISLCFGAVAAVCFIWPPTVGAALASLCFGASLLRGER